jgi:5'-3' exonuclease
MGIPHLYKWLKNKSYKGVLKRGVPQNVSSLSLDFNSIIHKVAQMVYAYGEGENPARKKILEKSDPNMIEAEFYQALSIKLLEIIGQVQPRDTLTIAVDGVAPQSKISQQRQRRFRSAMESSGTGIFNSSAITPGTEFMKRLDNFIQRWLISSSHLLPSKVIYSSHMVPGEGEHKVLSLMRNGEISGDGAHVVYGMDADLIMLNLLAPLDPIFLMREDINDVIDIDNFRTAIIEELGSETAIADFVVMLFFIGNDFLPHIVTLTDLDESIETLMRIYKMNKTSLTFEKEINWEGFSSYLKALSKEENRLLELESIRDVKYPSRMMEMATTRSSTLRTGKVTEVTTVKVENVSRFDPDIFRSAWYENAFELKENNKVFEKLIPGYKFGTTNNKIVDLVKSYLTGISWVYRYYTSGMEFVNTDFVYRSHYAPLITDISDIASLVGDKVEIPKEEYEFSENALEINPVHQLLAVIPLKSKNLIPIEVLHLTREDSMIADYFPKTEIIERDGINNDWQGILLINFVDMERIIQAVELTSIFSPQRIQEFSQVDNIILKKDPEVIEMEKKNRKFKEYLQKESYGRGYQGRGRSYGRGYQRKGYEQGRGYQKKPYEQGRGYQKKSYEQGRGYQKKPYEQGRGYQKKSYEQGRGYQKKPYEQGRGYQKKEYGSKTYSGKSSGGRGETSKLEVPVLSNFPPTSVIKPKTSEIQKFEL